MSFINDLDYGVEARDTQKTPFLKVVRPTTGENGTWTETGQIGPGEFVLSSDMQLHGFAVEFLPMMSFPTKKNGQPVVGRRYRNPDEFTKTLCSSYDSVRPVVDHSIGNKPPFFDPRFGTDFVIDFNYEPNQAQRDANNLLHVGGCEACPLGQWKDKVPPLCRPSAIIPVFVLRSLVFDPASGLQGNPIEFYRDNQMRETDLVKNDDQLLQYYDFIDWNQFAVFTVESYALDALVSGVWTVDGSREQIPNINYYLQRFTFVGARNAEVSEMLAQYDGGPKHFMMFTDGDNNLYTVQEAMEAERGDLKFYGLRTLRMFTVSTPHKKPNMPNNITPRITLGTGIITEMEPAFAEYIGKRRLANQSSSVAEFLGWRTTEDFLNDAYSYEALPAPPSAAQLPAGEPATGITPAGRPAATREDDYGFGVLLDDDDL